ncbi:putative transcription factor interactor and regulator CCHC(Zn) family [Rosa chinensis]|uniref:Putative transcription factor interactor and regulator CCHC(Zn) family n=1 Tax=Rosa chinensis TaxID=74649 RepID=A0A2P6RQF6_ROSCH|nr:uncharacterized protein LOC112189928 [Rosa chinensis]PRQ48672.1 putative transcription factor interactor and regulator CCHC(Zn) family [Rosa chinensis]
MAEIEATIARGEQTEIDKGESQTPWTKSRKRKQNAHCCCRCHDPKTRRRAKTRKPPLPEGFGYVPSAVCVDKNGNYIPRFSDRVAYMSCHRCGMKGDHWDPFCPNSINDPPDSGEAAPTRNPSWNYILRNFNLKEYLDKKNKTDGKPEPPRRKAVKSKVSNP